MKKLLSIPILLLFCCYCHTLFAQTHIRNYSTHTEYITVPKTTVPSSYKPYSVSNYNYQKPAKTEREIQAEEKKAAEDEAKYQAALEAEAERYNMYLSMIKVGDYYDQNKFTSVIESNNYTIKRELLSKEHQAYYNGILFNSLLQEKQYAELAKIYIDLYKKYPIHTDIFGDNEKFNLRAADILQSQNFHKEACDFYDLAHAGNQHNQEFHAAYCVATALTAGREEEASRAFAILLDYENVKPMDYYFRGWYYVDNNNTLAITDLDKFISMADEKHDAYLLRAKAYFNVGNYKQCISDATTYKKTHDCSECADLISKSEAKLKEQASPASIAEQKRKEIELAEQKRKIELELAEQKSKGERELAQLKQKAEADALVLQKMEDEFNAYIKQNNLTETIIRSNTTPGKYTSYCDAIEVGDLKSVYFLWKQGNDINAEYKNDRYTLFDALKFEHYAIAKFLLTNNFNVQLENNTGNTPLHVICDDLSFNELQIAKLLLEKGADINAVNKFGSTPLHFAIKSYNIVLLKFLLENGAATNIFDNDAGKYPLGLARKYENKEAVKLLKEYNSK